MKKNKLKLTLQTLPILFTAPIAGFSIAYGQRPLATAKPTIKSKSNADNSQNLILQTAKDDPTWFNKVKQDLLSKQNFSIINSKHLQFTKHTVNQNQVKRGFSVRVEGSVYWREQASFSSSWKTGDVRMRWVEVSFGKGISSKNYVYTNANYDGYRVNWSSSVTRSQNWSTNLYVSVPDKFAIDDYLNQITVNVCSQGSGNKDEFKTTISKVSVEGHDLYGSSWSYNPDWNGAETQNSKTFTMPNIYIGSTNYYEQNQQIDFEKIFISSKDIANHQFTDGEIKSLIRLHDASGLIDPQKVTWQSYSVDRSANSITLNNVVIKTNSSNVTLESQNVSLPIEVVNFDFLVKASETSSPTWEHLPSGETRYWSTKPETRVSISENYLKALYFATHKKELIAKLDTDGWSFVSGDKQLAVNAINAYGLNDSNYASVLQAYKMSHDQSILSQLKSDNEITDIIAINGFEQSSYDNYLHIFKTKNISFKFGAITQELKSVLFTDFDKNGILRISDNDIRTADPYKTSWSMKVSELKIDNLNGFVNQDNKFEISNDDLKRFYDVDFKYVDASKTSVTHSYLYQTHGIDISSNISFILEDGSMLDENFKVTRASATSSLKVNDYGYTNIRYWTTFSSGIEEYVTVVLQGTDWFSPKYQKKMIDLDKSFDANKLEYLFNQDLQLIINPYQTNPSKSIDATTPQSFGLGEVIDEFDGNKRILESWNDGLWSHSSNSSGQAIFDGIFGADVNGIFDQNGHISSGKHKIGIKLKNQNAANLKTNFSITVDKDPVKVETKSTSMPIQTLLLQDDEHSWHEVYFSSGPIHFSTKDTDLASVEASFLDGEGNWYELPIQIKSQQVMGQWTQVIDSTVDYAGFAKVNISDQAGNKKTIYFWLQKQNEAIPDVAFDRKLLIDDEERNLQGGSLNIFKSKPTIVVSNPLVSGIDIKALDINNGALSESKDQNVFKIDDYKFHVGTDYSYGKPITSSQSTLTFAGDELKPFLTQSLNQVKWQIQSKQITFTRAGLFKLTLHTRLEKNALVEKYIYIKDDAMQIINPTLFENEQANISPLPNTDEGEKNNIDKEIDAIKTLNLDIPKFLVKGIKVKYSLLWYTEFTDLPVEDYNFTKEGKYLIDITDIYGEIHSYKLLVLNKDLTADKRKNLNLAPIYADSSKPETAFWKGANIWNYYRYEDKDHAKWEHDEFINSAIANGLTQDQAEWLFQKLKQDPNWDGSFAINNPEDFDFKKKYQDEKNDAPHFSFGKQLSPSAIGGIIAGSTIVGSGIIALIVWQLIKRFRRRAIK